MIILYYILQASFSFAMACEVNRTLADCTTNCSDSARSDFSNYVASESSCGVQKGSLPFVMSAPNGKPRLGTIVLVHGLTAGPDHMQQLAKDLRNEGYNVVVPILKGHGEADEALQESSIDEWKKDVNFAGAVAERLGRPVHILGHSTGGMLAAIDASEHRGRYSSLTGLDPVFNFNGPMGYQTKYPCLARHVWNFPSEILAGQKPVQDYLYKRCSGSTLSRQPDVIRFEVDRQIQDIVEKSCPSGKFPLPHFNYERPLQALCSLKEGTDQLDAEKIKNLPPIHLELTEDKSIYEYQSREQLIKDVKTNSDTMVNTLRTGEIEKNTFHDLMLAPCAEHYPAMNNRIKSWFKQHSNGTTR